MKKILLLAVAIVFTALMAAPSFAVDVTFDGQYRVRAISIDNSDFNDATDDYSSWIDQRFRLGITAKEAPVTGYVQLQIGGTGPNNSYVWGNSGGTGSGAGFTVTARQAYLDFPVGPVQLRLGRTYASHKFLAGGMFENIADRYIVSYKASPELAVSFIHAKGRESSANIGSNTIGASSATYTGNDNDRNIYNLGFNYMPQGAPFDLAARVYYVRDGGSTGFTQAGTASTATAGTWDAWWLTAETNIKLDPIKIYFSAAYQTGETKSDAAGTPDLDIEAYALHADVNAAFGPAKVGVVGGIGSGDDNATDNKLKTFFAPGGSSYVHTHIYLQDGENGYSVANLLSVPNAQNGALNNRTLGNLTWYGAYADYKVNDDLTLSAKIAQFRSTEELAGTSDKIGEEYDLTANYKLHKGLSLFAFAAFFEPDDALTGGGTAADDTVSVYYARLQFDF